MLSKIKPKGFLARCIMKGIEHNQSENIELLMEIIQLRKNLDELYHEKGPACSDYISLSIELKLLTTEYFEEKSLHLSNM
jgi:hypothetical protein